MLDSLNKGSKVRRLQLLVAIPHPLASLVPASFAPASLVLIALALVDFVPASLATALALVSAALASLGLAVLVLAVHAPHALAALAQVSPVPASAVLVMTSVAIFIARRSIELYHPAISWILEVLRIFGTNVESFIGEEDCFRLSHYPPRSN